MSMVPPEWKKHKAVWITWPSMRTWWSGGKSEICGSFAEMAAIISRYVLLRINCAPSGMEKAKKALNAAKADLRNMEFYPHETNDVWCRDSGAIFKADGDKLEALDFKYNAWGGKFPPWDLDDALASKMAKAAGAKCLRIENFICEGGALEFSEDGVLLTTDCVVLNPNRNKISAAQAEEILKNACGAKKVIRLADGLAGDDTDGHIDNIARFTPGGEILCAYCAPDNPSHKQLNANLRQLAAETNMSGKKYETVKLSLPDAPVMFGKRRLPASYANYLVTNNLVLVPTFAQEYSDDRAVSTIAEFFPDRDIWGIDARIFLEEGGTVHCLTQQEPLV